MLQPCRLAPLKKINKCPDGGFARLQVKLLSGLPVNCEICRELLKQHHFSQADLEKTISDVVSGTRQVTVKSFGESLTRAEDGGSQCDCQRCEETGLDSRVAALAWLKTQEPTFELLEAGSYGKKIPIRCTVCKTSGWRDGKVLDLCVLKRKPVEHYLTQHKQSSTHQRNLRRAQLPVVKVPRVPCQGLSTNDEERGSRLVTFREEMLLWAQYGNFQDTAKHSYAHYREERTCVVTAFNCEKECELNENFDGQVCPQCLQLGSPHGATGSHVKRSVCLSVSHRFLIVCGLL